jgi:hypothetical protein
MKDEELKLVLEALEKIVDAIYVNSQQEAEAVCKANDAITVIKQARAAPVRETMAAIDTLKFLGYTYHGGERWKPPLGKRPDWLDTPAAQHPDYTKEDVDRAFSAGLVEGEKLAIESQPPVQEPIQWSDYEPDGRRLPGVPDAFGTREGEHPQYIQGWNDCRAEMLKGMK